MHPVHPASGRVATGLGLVVFHIQRICQHTPHAASAVLHGETFLADNPSSVGTKSRYGTPQTQVSIVKLNILIKYIYIFYPYSPVLFL
jgi:hypothetical protein